MVLVDSSIWVSFLQSGVEPELVQLLNLNQVPMHDMVFGEIALGSQSQRKSAIQLLPLLPTIDVASHAEVMLLIDKHQLYGCGIGYVDVHLLTSAVLHPGTQLWTRDKRLLAAAHQLGLAFDARAH